MNPLTLLATRLLLALRAPRPRDQRGDVPGWVLVTVMTAGLVMGLWQVAGDRLGSMLSAALDSVHS
jgi:hypothetical protein